MMEENKEDIIKAKQKSISDDEKEILGRPNFQCIAIAQRMRQMGYQCEQKAEDEQAMVISTMFHFFKEYGTNWAKEMNKYLKPE